MTLIHIGAFGVVYGGTLQRSWDSEAVAVKTVKGVSICCSKCRLCFKCDVDHMLCGSNLSTIILLN